MPYRTMGWIHVTAARLWHDRTGQGTVEYVGIMLLLATVLAAVVSVGAGEGRSISKLITNELKDAIGSVKK